VLNSRKSTEGFVGHWLTGRNKYFRSTPLEYGLISLGGYLRFWALVFLVVTAWLAFVKKEDAVSENDPDMDVKKVYKVMWSIIRLKSMLFTANICPCTDSQISSHS
jgi:PAT family acetyl-CoA transporter-like MFS transporter 1